MHRYSWPRRMAASTIRSSVALPSLQSVCECRSPWIIASSTRAGSVPLRAAWSSPRFSRNSGGIQSMPSRA